MINKLQYGRQFFPGKITIARHTPKYLRSNAFSLISYENIFIFMGSWKSILFFNNVTSCLQSTLTSGKQVEKLVFVFIKELSFNDVLWITKELLYVGKICPFLIFGRVVLVVAQHSSFWFPIQTPQLFDIIFKLLLIVNHFNANFYSPFLLHYVALVVKIVIRTKLQQLYFYNVQLLSFSGTNFRSQSA